MSAVEEGGGGFHIAPQKAPSHGFRSLNSGPYSCNASPSLSSLLHTVLSLSAQETDEVTCM